MSMRERLVGFRDCEEGAGTVDFVVLTGGIVLMGIALMYSGMFDIRSDLEQAGASVGSRVNVAAELSAP